MIKLYLFFSSMIACLLVGIYLVLDSDVLVILRLVIAGLLLGYPVFIIYFLKYGEKLNELLKRSE